MVLARTFATVAMVLALATGVALASEKDAKAAAPVAGVAPGIVDAETARKLVASGIKVVDVRTPSEFGSGHVPGAINVPYDQVAARLAEIGPPSTPVLLYCKSGRRSDIAAKALREHGFSVVYDLQAYDRWVASEPKK